MKCVRCKREIEPQHWTAGADIGRIRHLTCPSKNSKSAKRWRRLREMSKIEARGK